MDEKKVKEAIEFLQRQICTLDAQKEYDEYCNPVHSETLELAIELCEIAIEEGKIYELDESGYMIIGGKDHVHLDAIDNGSYLEITKEDLEECFELTEVE